MGRLYFAVQAIAGAAWWVLVFTNAHVRQATLGELDPTLVAIFDVPLFVIASALAAAGARWASWIVGTWCCLVAAAMAGYATLTQLAGLGAVLMIAAAAASVTAAILMLKGRIAANELLRGPFAFRPARAAKSGKHLSQTTLQLLLFWGVFLVVLPLIITWFEHRWQLHLAPPWWVGLIGLIVLLAASALGVWSAVTMAVMGRGTPLPSRTATHLVIAGPYRYVRNPMAVAGIAQGVAVGCLLGSWLVVLYALAGSLVWNWAVRPLEEADLKARFGAEFTAYASRVGCWVPTFGRARPVADAE